MQLFVFELILVLVLKKISNDSEEFIAESLRSGKGAGKVRGNQIDGAVNVILVKKGAAFGKKQH